MKKIVKLHIPRIKKQSDFWRKICFPPPFQIGLLICLFYFVCLYSIYLYKRDWMQCPCEYRNIAALYWNRSYRSLESDCFWENSVKVYDIKAMDGCHKTLIQYFARYYSSFFFFFFAKLYTSITFIKEKKWLLLCPFTSMLIMKLFVTPRLKIAFNETFSWELSTWTW